VFGVCLPHMSENCMCSTSAAMVDIETFGTNGEVRPTPDISLGANMKTMSSATQISFPK
jgi:hypothetical protein